MNTKTRIYSSHMLVMTILIAAMGIFCGGGTPTAELLNGNSLNVPVKVDPVTATIAAETQTTFTITGGKAPYTSQISGSGTATISGDVLTYTAGGLIDYVSLIVSDARNNQATISINVNAKDILPTNVSGLVYWLKADALTLMNGDPVTNWTDSSGNGWNFASGGTATFRTNVVNALPAVEFNFPPNSGQHLDRAYDPALNPSAMTYFILYAPDTVTPAFIFSDRVGTVAGYFLMIESNGSVTSNLGNTIGATWTSLGSLFTLSANVWHLTDVRADASVVTFTDNGILQSQLATTANAFVAANNGAPVTRLGASDLLALFFQGKIAEVIFYNRVLTAAESQNIRCYIKKKYALTLDCGR